MVNLSSKWDGISDFFPIIFESSYITFNIVKKISLNYSNSVFQNFSKIIIFIFNNVPLPKIKLLYLPLSIELQSSFQYLIWAGKLNLGHVYITFEAHCCTSLVPWPTPTFCDTRPMPFDTKTQILSSFIKAGGTPSQLICSIKFIANILTAPCFMLFYTENNI